MKRAVLCFYFLGLLACQQTANSPATAPATPSQQLGGTSSGGVPAIVDLLHCHSRRHHVIVDLFLGQGLRLITKWNWPQDDATDGAIIADPTGANYFSSYDTAVYSNGVVTQLNMAVNSSTQILLDAHWALQDIQAYFQHVPAILTIDGKSGSMSCTVYPIWTSDPTCPDKWHSIQYLAQDPSYYPPQLENLCVPDRQK